MQMVGAGAVRRLDVLVAGDAQVGFRRFEDEFLREAVPFVAGFTVFTLDGVVNEELLRWLDQHRLIRRRGISTHLSS